MSVFSVTYSIRRELVLDHSVICPKCGYAMEVFNLYTKRNKFDGAVGYCTQNCKHAEGDQYFIYSYDVEHVEKAANKIKIEICALP